MHPWMMHDGYFDITETKMLTWSVLTVLFLFAAAIGCAVWSKPINFRSEHAVFLALAVLYSVVSVISAGGSWLGMDNRYQGVLTWMLYFLMFLFVSQTGVTVAGVWSMVAGFAGVMVLAAINHWELDLLRVMGDLIPFDQGRYISTIGNINFFGSYVCLVLPVVWVLWCFSHNGRREMILLVCIVLGSFGAAASKSECTVLGLGAAYLLIPFIGKSKPEILPRWSLLLGVSALGLLLFRAMTHLIGGYGVSALMELLMHPVIAGGMLLMGFGGFVCCRNRNDRQLAAFGRYYRLSMVVVLLVVVLILVLINTVFLNAELGSLTPFLRFNSEWGSDRGRVWHACLNRWVQMPWWQKLLGGGSGFVVRTDRLDPVFVDAILDAAHCEYLHYLLTHGILGLGLYLGLNYMVLHRAVKTGEPLTLALSVGVIGYLAQSGVNIAQPLTTPLYFVLLSVLAGPAPAGKKELRR